MIKEEIQNQSEMKEALATIPAVSNISEQDLHRPNESGEIQPYTEQDIQKIVSYGAELTMESDTDNQILGDTMLKDITNTMGTPVRNVLEMISQINQPVIQDQGLTGLFRKIFRSGQNALEREKRSHQSMLVNVEQAKGQILKVEGDVQVSLENFEKSIESDKQNKVKVLENIAYLTTLSEEVAKQNFQNPDDQQQQVQYVNHINKRINGLWTSYARMDNNIKRNMVLKTVSTELCFQLKEEATAGMATLKSQIAQVTMMDSINQGAELVKNIQSATKRLDDVTQQYFSDTVNQIAENSKPMYTVTELEQKDQAIDNVVKKFATDWQHHQDEIYAQNQAYAQKHIEALKTIDAE